MKQMSFYTNISEYRSTIMGLSMLSVMLFHQSFVIAVPFNIFHNIGYWGVDVFLFLSGMGLVNSINKCSSIKSFYKRRFLRLLPSCLFCGTIRFLIIFFILKKGDVCAKDFLSIFSFDLWFIPAIIILYLLFPKLYRLLDKMPVATFLLIFIYLFINDFTLRPMVGTNFISPLGIFYRTAERLPVFAVGAFMSIKKNQINEKKNPILISFFIMALIIKILKKGGFSFQGMLAAEFFAIAVGSAGLLFFVCLLLRKIPDILLRPIKFLGIHSLELYLVHGFIFWVLNQFCKSGNPWILLFGGLMVSCIAAYVCKSCTDKLKFNILTK